MGQNEYGGAKQVTWNIYLYAKTLGIHGDKINILERVMMPWSCKKKVRGIGLFSTIFSLSARLGHDQSM